jgi:hypothetical protein
MSNATQPEGIISVAVNFNSYYFGIFFAEYGIPMVVMAVVSGLLLSRAKFNIKRLNRHAFFPL